MTGRFYLDHAATSPLRPEAKAAMAPWWGETFGNTGSSHEEGRRARAAMQEARAQVAALVGALPEDVTFTSGATEASNLAVRGAAHIRRNGGKRLVSTAIEHAATRKSLEALAVDGYQVTYLEIDQEARIRPELLRQAIGHGTSVVSVIAGHNELGSLQPLHAIADAAHAVGAVFHVDAVQAAGYLDLADVPWDLLSLSGHKLGGPQGVGALVRRDKFRVSPLLFGGSQEGGLRPGTTPVALLAGFGAAAEAVAKERRHESSHLAQLRDALREHLLTRTPSLMPLGPADPALALPQILAIGVPGVTGDELVYALDRAGVAAASASACLSGARSPVLDRINFPQDAGLMRLSLGWTTEASMIAPAAEAITAALRVLAAQSPFERRRGPLARRAELAGVAIGPAHWEAAEAVFEYYRAESVLPGPRALARLAPSCARLEELYPYGLATLAVWLGLPVPRGGCRPLSG